MEKQVLEIIKDKDDWKFTVEIKENAKGEPQISIKTRSDGSVVEAGNDALAEYHRVKQELVENQRE